jgi:hypothetical protein
MEADKKMIQVVIRLEALIEELIALIDMHWIS